MDRPLNSLLQSLKTSLASAIARTGSQESQNFAEVVELRSVLLALLDSCADATQGRSMLPCVPPARCCMAVPVPPTAASAVP